jgi:hypothetical protein
VEQGPFTVFVVVEDLQHLGLVSYDDDRDTVPDRQVESNGLAAFEFTIEYNPAVLALAGVESGPSLGRSGRAFQCLGPAQQPGSLRYGCLSPGSEPEGLQGTLTLAAVEFTPLAPGLSPLLLEAELAGPLGDGATVEVSGGAARVTGNPLASQTRPPGATTTPGIRPSATGPRQETPGTVVLGTPAVTGTSRLRATPTKPPGENDEPTHLTVPPDDPPGGPSATEDDGWSGGAGLWAAVAAGAVGAAVTGGLLVFYWRQRRHQGGA